MIPLASPERDCFPGIYLTGFILRKPNQAVGYVWNVGISHAAEIVKQHNLMPTDLRDGNTN